MSAAAPVRRKRKARVTVASRWLVRWQRAAPPRQVSIDTWTQWCRFLVLQRALPNAMALMQQKAQGAEEGKDARLSRDVVAHVRAMDKLWQELDQLVQGSALSRYDSGRLCLAAVRRAVRLDCSPCAEAQTECCITHIDDTPRVSVVVTTPRSQAGTHRETFVVAAFLQQLLYAWMLVGRTAQTAYEYAEDWLQQQHHSLQRLEEVPTSKQVLLLHALNGAVRYVQRMAACPGFIV